MALVKARLQRDQLQGGMGEQSNPFAALPPAERADAAMVVLSWVLGAIDALAVLWWIALGLHIASAFRDIFADFGAALSVPTQVVISPAYGLGMAVAFTMALATTALVPMRPARRAAVLGGVLVAHVAAFGATAYAMYLPIFEMAGNIR